MKKSRPGSTSNDVAALAGVSQSAVSRAFTIGSSISVDKRARILAAAQTLNYIPNAVASSLITKRSNTIAIILGDIANPFYVQVLKTFIDKLQGHGRQTLSFTIDPGSSSDEAIMQVLRHQVDGIVLTAAQVSTKATSLCLDRGIPIVLFNRYIPGSDVSVVRCDNESGGRILAKAFLDAGAKTFAILSGDPMGTTSQDRIKGFSDCLLENGIAAAAINIIEGKSVYDGAFEAILNEYGNQAKPLPDAIFGVNDLMAMAAMDALRHELSARVPEDVMVCGFDNLAEGARSPYQLTTVSQPIDEMVEETLKILDLEGEKPRLETGLERRLPCQAIWRSSLPCPKA